MDNGQLTIDNGRSFIVNCPLSIPCIPELGRNI